MTLLHEAMEDAQAGRKELHFSLRFPFLSFTRHRRLNNCCRTTTRWQIEVRVMIARIKTRFHLPAERTEDPSDLHYQSTETPNVLVRRFSQIDGYRCLSLIRALAVVNCQSALA